MDQPIDSSRHLDVSAVELTRDVLRNLEQLAEHTHNVWMRERIAQGWKQGPLRDDIKKLHPCLRPYGELPETEKELNRVTALETVKALVKAIGHGKGEEAQALLRRSEEANCQPAAVMAQLKKATLTPGELRRLWMERVPGQWQQKADVYRRAVDTSLRLGEAFLAFDIAAEGLQVFKGDLRLLQLQALALARTGATRRANQMLQHLRSSGHQDEETLGLLARTHKDFWS